MRNSRKYRYIGRKEYYKTLGRPFVSRGGYRL